VDLDGNQLREEICNPSLPSTEIVASIPTEGLKKLPNGFLKVNATKIENPFKTTGKQKVQSRYMNGTTEPNTRQNNHKVSSSIVVKQKRNVSSISARSDRSVASSKSNASRKSNNSNKSSIGNEKPKFH